jgi:HEAT repeat protein
MNIYPALSISLLSQLTNRELQSNYLNHLDRTAEIASLLTQIADKDSALGIVNLALEVDLCLGASLTSSLVPELQQIVVDRINSLEIPTRLKINLWHKTKSKAALPYLQDIFVFKHRQPNDYDGYETIESAIASIIDLDRNLAISLLIESLSDARFYPKAIDILTELAPLETIESLSGLLSSVDLRNYNVRSRTIAALGEIGTEAAITKIRDTLHEYKSQWSNTDWIWGLGIVAEPAMIEQLIYLLYEPEQYIYRSPHISDSEEYYADEASRLCCDAISALEKIGGEKVFDWLHQAMYWTRIADYPNPFGNIVEALFRLDPDRTFIALEGALQSYDPVVRKRAVLALTKWGTPISERNLSILLNAIVDPDLDVQLEVIFGIRSLINSDEFENIDPGLRNSIILKTKLILLKHVNHLDPEFRDRVIKILWVSEPDERALMVELLGNVSPSSVHILSDRFSNIVEPSDLPIVLTYLHHELLEIRVCSAASIGRIGNNSIVPILLQLIHDSELEIRESAVISMIDLGSTEIFPTIVKLASNTELVGTLIWEMKRYDRSTDRLTLFSEFHRDIDLTLKFLDTAEQTLIEAINDDQSDGISLFKKICALGEIGSDLSIPTLLNLIHIGYPVQYEVDQECVAALSQIGTDRAISALLELLPDPTTLGGAISRTFRYDGKLGVIPHLWSDQRQIYSQSESAAILEIQSRERLYNPDFSDRSHPLFEPPRPRLRQILLGDSN